MERLSELRRCRFQILDQGRKAIWQITNVCNYECPYCIFASGPKRISGELSTVDAVRVVAELQKEGFTYVKLTGGEPTTRKDLKDIVAAIGGAGIAYDLSTNASRITPELLAVFKRFPPQCIHVSLDGGDAAIQSAMRGPKTFFRTVDGVRMLTKSGIRVRIGSVIGKTNQNELASTVTLAIQLGAQEIIFSRLIPAGRIKGEESYSSTLSDLELAEHMKHLREQFGDQIAIKDHFSHGCAYREQRCPGGDSFIYIDNYGRISPCTWATDNGIAQLTSSSLREESLSALLTGDELTRYRAFVSRDSTCGCPVAGVGS